MSAVIDPWRMSTVTFFSAWKSPYQRFRSRVGCCRSDRRAAAPSSEDPAHVVERQPVGRVLGEDDVGRPDLDESRTR